MMRFHTSEVPDKRISFKEYVDRMQERQDNVRIYGITGKSIAVVSSTLYLEILRRSALRSCARGVRLTRAQCRSEGVRRGHLPKGGEDLHEIEWQPKPFERNVRVEKAILTQLGCTKRG